MTYEAWRTRFLEAVDTALYPPDWLDWLVGTGQARFWGNENAAIIAHIKTYPSGLMEVHGLLAAGEAGAIVELIPLAEAWGAENGCKRASIASRPGWVRVMESFGYAVHQVEIVKGL
jgi:hypothetical protein